MANEGSAVLAGREPAGGGRREDGTPALPLPARAAHRHSADVHRPGLRVIRAPQDSLTHLRQQQEEQSQARPEK
jgi:hypothetical protein